MNVTLANTINFAKDSLNLAKETAVNYGGRAITQLKHLPVTMHEDFRVACGVTATVTAVALVAGECFGEYVWKKIDGNDRKTESEIVKRLVFTATLASAYAGLSYATGFPQSKTVSALIFISFTAIRCLVSALEWQKTSISYLEGKDTLKQEKTTVEQERNTLQLNLANLQTQNNTLQQEKANIEIERDNLRANEANIQRMQAALQEKTDILDQQNQEVQKASDWLHEREKGFLSTIQDLQDEKAILETKNTTLKQKKSKLNEQNEELNAVIQQFEKRDTLPQNKINTLQQENQELTQELNKNAPLPGENEDDF